MPPTFVIQTIFDQGTAYGIDTERITLPLDRPDAAISELWDMIDNRGLIPVTDGDFTRSVSFHPAHVLSVHVLA